MFGADSVPIPLVILFPSRDHSIRCFFLLPSIYIYKIGEIYREYKKKSVRAIVQIKQEIG
jgi:hypothetical protein